MNLTIQLQDYVSPYQGQVPRVEVNDLIYVERYEETAYDHWMLGGSESCLTGMVNGKVLTKQAGVGARIEYLNGKIRLGAAKGYALISDLMDNRDSYTMSTIVMPEDFTSLMVLMGTLGGNDVGAGGGFFTSANSAYATYRPSISSGRLGGAGYVFDSNKPMFVSFSVSVSQASFKAVVVQGSKLVEYTISLSSFTPSNEGIALGNSRYTTSSAYNTLWNQFYEFILHDRDLTIAEMRAVADRAIYRQANRGVTV